MYTIAEVTLGEPEALATLRVISTGSPVFTSLVSISLYFFTNV
jgi:hypothetical protein